MNKYFFRNRIKVCNKPSQKAYFETLIEQWGSKDLVDSLKKDNGDFDYELLAKALWDTKSYSELKQLGAIFAHKIEGMLC